MLLRDLGVCPFRFGIAVAGKPLVKCKLFESTRKIEECFDCPIPNKI